MNAHTTMPMGQDCREAVADNDMMPAPSAHNTPYSLRTCIFVRALRFLQIGRARWSRVIVCTQPIFCKLDTDINNAGVEAFLER